MSDLLNYDNKFMRTLSSVIDSFLLGLLWLVCCIPVVTVGASSAAFYYSFHKCVIREQGYPLKEFFHGFKSNFKQATVLWLIMCLLSVVLYLDVFILTQGILDLGVFSALLLASALMILALTVIWALCAFPYLARFENPTKTVIKNSMIITVANLHWSLLLLLIFAGSVFLFLSFPIVSLFIPAVYMFFANRILERVFRKYMSPEDLENS